MRTPFIFVHYTSFYYTLLPQGDFRISAYTFTVLQAYKVVFLCVCFLCVLSRIFFDTVPKNVDKSLLLSENVFKVKPRCYLMLFVPTIFLRMLLIKKHFL